MLGTWRAWMLVPMVGSVRTLRLSVLGPLSAGSTAQAFLGYVYQNDQPRPAVIVNLPDQVIKQPLLFKRVVAETQFAAQIDHPNVSQVYGICKWRNSIARVVEYAAGESLRLVCAAAERTGTRIPPPVAIALIADACMGAHHVHELGMHTFGSAMVHGGIRPETLLVSYTGTSKVTGYGTFALADELAKSASPITSGRDSYTALEQTIGGRGAATVRTDVYALGAALYEVLTGKPPVRSDTEDADARVEQILASSRSGQGLTTKLATMVMKAMRRKATDRFGTALELRAALLETGAAASPPVIEAFMDGLFPLDSGSRAQRFQLFESAQTAPPPVEEAEVIEPEGSSTRLTPIYVPAVSAPDPVFPARPPSQPGVAPPSLDVQASGGAEPPAPPAASPAPQPATVEAPPSSEAPPQEPAAKQKTRSSTRETKAVSEPLDTAKRPARPAARPRRPSEDLEEDSAPPPPAVPRSRGILPFLAGLACGVSLTLGGVLFINPRAFAPPAAEPPRVAAAAPQASAPPVAAAPAPRDTGHPTASPGTTSNDKTPAEDKPEPETKAAKARNQPTQLVISANPSSLEILVDGKSVGRGSATLTVKPGSYSIRARDKDQGIDVERSVKVAEGTTKRVSMDVGQGVLVIDAPPGCEVFVDNRKVGTTPLQPLDLYEGRHLILVKQGSATYKHVVPLKPNVESTLTVQFQTRGN